MIRYTFHCNPTIDATEDANITPAEVKSQMQEKISTVVNMDNLHAWYIALFDLRVCGLLGMMQTNVIDKPYERDIKGHDR
jgi:hypothetical protein